MLALLKGNHKTHTKTSLTEHYKIITYKFQNIKKLHLNKPETKKQDLPSMSKKIIKRKNKLHKIK